MKNRMKVITVVLLCIAVAFAFSACGDDDDSKDTGNSQEKQSVKIDPQAETLTVTGEASEDGGTLSEKVYTKDELSALGTETVTYSGRSSDAENERIFKKKTGVDLRTVLEDAGVKAGDIDDAVIRVTASDEYQMEYEVDELYDELVAFRDNKSDKCDLVGAMIAISDKEGDYPCPFELVFGQEDYDKCDNSAQDFNMQKWGRYIQLIEVSFPED